MGPHQKKGVEEWMPEGVFQYTYIFLNFSPDILLPWYFHTEALVLRLTLPISEVRGKALLVQRLGHKLKLFSSAPACGYLSPQALALASHKCGSWRQPLFSQGYLKIFILFGFVLLMEFKFLFIGIVWGWRCRMKSAVGLFYHHKNP